MSKENEVLRTEAFMGLLHELRKHSHEFKRLAVLMSEFETCEDAVNAFQAEYKTEEAQAHYRFLRNLALTITTHLAASLLPTLKTEDTTDN